MPHLEALGRTPSSNSGSHAAPAEWRRFFRLTFGLALAASALIYAFIVTVDPYDVLPFSPPFARRPVDSNSRFAFPALARSGAFDSAVLGTSTSRLLRPATLNQEFGARFVNLSINAATAYEQLRLLQLFLRRHPAAKAIILGLDVEWCGVGDAIHRLTDRAFPEWMYDAPYFRGYAESFNLNTLEKAGQAFAGLTGMKPDAYGHDGYASFVLDDRLYDRARVAMHLTEAEKVVQGAGAAVGDPRGWRYPALEMLRTALRMAPAQTRMIVYFVPYNRVFLPRSGRFWAEYAECKRRVTEIASEAPGAVAVDFMRPSPITLDDDNYWDAIHYRVGIAERVARDLAAASRGEISPQGDYELLAPGWAAAAD